MDEETKQIFQKLTRQVRHISHGGKDLMGFEALVVALCGGYPGENGTGNVISAMNNIADGLFEIAKAIESQN